MLSEMTSAQLSGWMQYYDVEPWGQYPEERRMATLATLTANCHGAHCRADEFMPTAWRPVPEPMDWRRIKSVLSRQEA